MRRSPLCSSFRPLLCLLLAAISSGARLWPQTSAWSHQAWSTEDGLPQNSVHQVLVGRDGPLWIATEGGLARFDGFTFQTFAQRNAPTPPSDDLCCVAEDTSGTLWVGTSAGVARFDGKRFTRVDGDDGSAVRALVAADDGSLIVLTAEGSWRIASSRMTLLPSPAPVTAIAPAPDGGVLLASPSGIAHYRNGGVAPMAIPLPGSQPILGIAAAIDGVWLRTARDLLWIPGAGVRRSWRLGQQLPGTRLQALLPETGGAVWVGTNRGLVRVSVDGAVSGAVPELSTASVLSLTRDPEGDIWVGTETAGVQILRPQRFRTLPGLDDRAITSVVEATDGAIWLGTREDGLLRVRGGTVDRPSVESRLASQIVLSLAAGLHGDLWVGTPDGLNHLHPDGGVDLLTSANGLPDDFIRSLLVDPDGSVSIGTRRGFAHLHGTAVDQVVTRDDGLPSELVGALLRTPTPGAGSDLWMGTLGGLSRLRDGHLTTYTMRDGLAGDVVTALASDSPGSLWIGSRDGGLSLLRDGRFHTFRQLGMPASVESLLLDPRPDTGGGSLWMGTPHGILRVSLKALATCARRPACSLAVARYGYADGLPSETIAALGHPAAARTRSGELWFATPRGVALADPGEGIEASTPTPVVIERLEVDDVEQPLLTAPVTIAPGHRSLAITYAGLSYRTPSRTSYRYRLEGFDRQWIEAGPRRSAFYTNLPPGRYRFVVQASGNDGVWNGREATLSFRMLPPIYRRWWFYLVCLGCLGALASLLYYARLRQLRARFDAVLGERNRIAREIHDTLAQDLVGISLQLDVAAQLLRRSALPAVAEQLRSTRRLVQESITEARESIWELRATSERSSLSGRLGRIVERANERGTATQLTVAGTPRALPAKWESEILRVAGEAVTNSMRHAQPSAIVVSLDYAPRALVLAVRDDGRGFDPETGDVESSGATHFGLRGMRERAGNIHGHLRIRSAPGEGTVVTLEVALDEEEDHGGSHSHSGGG